MSRSDAVRIRVATPADAEAIARVHVDSWRAAYPGIVPQEQIQQRSYERRLAQWVEWLRSDAEAALVAEVDADVAGFSTLETPGEWDRPGEAEIRAFYVAPSHWRRGVGRALMAATLDRLRAAGATTAVLWVMRENEGARRFYEALGWHADGTEGDWEGVATVRYARHLAAQTSVTRA